MRTSPRSLPRPSPRSSHDKAHLTNADVLDAVADAMTYLSLVANAAGCDDLEKLLGDTFNMVSDRAGSAIKTRLGQP